MTTTNQLIIGIDLGTTNSLVAYCDEKGPRIIPDAQGRNLLPSIVRFDPDSGNVLATGFEANARCVEFPRETIFSAKRLMGRGIADAQNDLAYLPYRVVAGDHNTARIQVGGHIFSPQEVAAVILAQLKRQAEALFNQPVTKAVVTVPAYFDDAQRQATRDAARIAGLEVVRIINEPTAAAIAYNLGQKHDDTTVAVFDLGGGTFDISILRLQKSDTGPVAQVLGVDGDAHLGGDDVDRMIVELIQSEVRTQFGQSINFPPSTQQAFRNFAQAAKIKLSDAVETQLEVDLGAGRVYRRTLARAELEAMITPWVDAAIARCKNALTQAKLKTADIQRVIMVGGSTRIPLVRQRVTQFFGSDAYTALNPDEVVALGAAVMGSILAGVNRDMLLLDVIPLSLGIETMGGAVAKLITANTTIPARAKENFSTYVDGQTNVKIHVLQGERELASDCRSLGQFELRGIPPMPAGLPKIEVTFLVDANGILSVSAIEKRSEKSASIQIIPNSGLTRDEVAQMEAASLKFAKADMTAHRLIDLRNQARLDIRAIDRQLKKVGPLISDDYRAQITALVNAVKKFIDTPDANPDDFHKALDAMDKATVQLAEVAIKQTLTEI